MYVYSFPPSEELSVKLMAKNGARVFKNKQECIVVSDVPCGEADDYRMKEIDFTPPPVKEEKSWWSKVWEWNEAN